MRLEDALWHGFRVVVRAMWMVPLFGAFLVVSACTDSPCSDNPSVLVDSTGISFALDDECAVHRTPETPEFHGCAPGQRGVMQVWGRFISVGLGCLEGGYDLSTGGEAERPIICDRDADCPTLFEDVYECASGLCQHIDDDEFPRGELDGIDTRLLCFAPVPREDTVDPLGPAAQAVLELVGEACGPDLTNCQNPLPTGCWQL